MTLYIYPTLFHWDEIIPRDYPFIKIHGPEGALGCLLVFSNEDEYTKFCGDDFMEPIKMTQEVKNGKKQD